MATDYSISTCKILEEEFRKLSLHRPMQIQRYDTGDSLVYEIDPVSPGLRKQHACIHCIVEKAVGGGFAGQVYKVRITAIENGPVKGLETGKSYAMKILIPPGKGSLLFRNLVYWIGFQGPFQLQVNPAAARAGALWQKLIRRGAMVRFGSESAVNDIHATFVDQRLGSCGEISDWVDGRTWRLEVDDHLDELAKWNRGEKTSEENLGSEEYRTKKLFMKEFVALLHDMGAHEFARQYEWSTCKSQPNCLKRNDSEQEPYGGLVAVDFRAGLALLPFLPMSPGDIRLIFQGLKRGSLVQFDRGSFQRLEQFVLKHKEQFSDLRPLLHELKETEERYRNSLPDITHNHVHLFYSKTLWSTMLSSAITGWKVRNHIDARGEKKLRSNTFLTLLLFMLSFIPLAGPLSRKLIGHEQWQRHYASYLTSLSYLRRCLRGRAIEKAVAWHRSGRISEAEALAVARSPLHFLFHVPFSVLPAGLHRLLTQWNVLKDRLYAIAVRPAKLYFNETVREQWLRDMVYTGQKKHIINDADAATIISQIKEPYIQKYLKSLAVHVCTAPVTKIVAIMVAVMYVLAHPELSQAQAWAHGLFIVALFQVIPISPGSLTRGFYVLYVVTRDRDVKNYTIALPISFFKYIGYLAFPIQMTCRYPTLARFMAGYWATDAVHIVPVFGEHGALLERSVFNLLYNWPLTLRRCMHERAAQLKSLRPRYWHVGFIAVGAATIFGSTDYFYLSAASIIPDLKDIAWMVVLIPLFSGAAIAWWAGGASVAQRVIAAVTCGVIVGLLYTVIIGVLGYQGHTNPGFIVTQGIWRMFAFSVFSAIGVLVVEVKLAL